MMKPEGERRKADVVIIGGGASGLAAAAALGMSAPELDVLVIEKMDEPGRKLRATGSGRCNITNTAAEGYAEIMKFFTRIGLVTRVYENGLVYPYSESAADVADLLVTRAKELGVRFACGEEVVSIKASDRNVGFDTGASAGFVIESEYKDKKGRHKVITEAGYVVLAAGGKAGPAFGTTGDGYRIARALGHSIVTPVPVLTGIECEEWAAEHRPCAMTLAGTRTRGVVTLYKLYKNDREDLSRAEELFEEAGEIQFTNYGLSGICVFNMTRHMRYDRSRGESLEDFLVTADLYPDGGIGEFLRYRRENAFPDEKVGEVLRTVLKKNIAEYALRAAAVQDIHAADKMLAELSDEDIDEISRAVHCMTFHPEKLRGWKDAQATAGGVGLEEIDDVTSESKLIKGLYITGELADRDFQCGGFNLSNAWITGLASAASIAKKSKEGSIEIQ